MACARIEIPVAMAPADRVFGYLNRILADKTAIIIAHRLATVQRADRIITLKDGIIVEQGTHRELLEKSALYQELAQKQLKL